MTDGLIINPYRFGLPSLPPPYNISWAHSLWAGDTNWTNPGDGNPVDSWRNSSGGGDPASTSTNRPTYRASIAAYNNKPTVQFVRASSQYLDNNIADMTQAFSIVVIGNTNGNVSGAEILVGQGSNNARGVGDISTTYQGNFGNLLTGGTVDTNPHLYRYYANGASSVIEVDGTSIVTGDGGTNNLTRLTVGAGSNTTPAFATYLEGHLAFVGIIAGDVSGDAGWAAFKTWVATEYALTIA